MRLGVEPAAVTAAAGTVRDLAARVAALDPGPIGALVTAGMPESASAGLAVQLSDRLARELAALATDVAAHADRLGLAAEEYATAERSVVDQIGRTP